MVRRLWNWLRGVSPEPESDTYWTRIIYKNQSVLIERPNPVVETVFDPGGVTSRQEYLNEHYKAMKANRERANREWWALRSPDECLFL